MTNNNNKIIKETKEFESLRTQVKDLEKIIEKERKQLDKEAGNSQ
jgi:predicted  nucleic acid-binding Zn-ribbon protein